MSIKQHRNLLTKCWLKISNKCIKKNTTIRSNKLLKDNSNLSNWCCKTTFKTENWPRRRKGNRRKSKTGTFQMMMMTPVPQATCLKTSQINLKKKCQGWKVCLIKTKSRRMKNWQRWPTNKWSKKAWSKQKETKRKHFCKWSKMIMVLLRNIPSLYHRHKALIQLFLRQSKSQMNKICLQKYKFIALENKKNKE